MTHMSEAYKEATVKRILSGQPIKFKDIAELKQARNLFDRHPDRRTKFPGSLRLSKDEMTLTYHANKKAKFWSKTKATEKKTPPVKMSDSLQAAVTLLNEEVVKSMAKGLLPEFDFDNFRVTIKRVWKAQ